MLQAINNLTRDQALSFAFAIADVKAVRADPLDAYTFINDVEHPPGSETVSALRAYDIEPLYWSRWKRITRSSMVPRPAERLRIIAILISPVLPKAAHGIFDQLNWKMELSGKEERFSLADAEWGRLPDGHVVGKPTPLFPRIES